MQWSTRYLQGALGVTQGLRKPKIFKPATHLSTLTCFSAILCPSAAEEDPAAAASTSWSSMSFTLPHVSSAAIPGPAASGRQCLANRCAWSTATKFPVSCCRLLPLLLPLAPLGPACTALVLPARKRSGSFLLHRQSGGTESLRLRNPEHNPIGAPTVNNGVEVQRGVGKPARGAHALGQHRLLERVVASAHVLLRNGRGVVNACDGLPCGSSWAHVWAEQPIHLVQVIRMRSHRVDVP